MSDLEGGSARSDSRSYCDRNRAHCTCTERGTIPNLVSSFLFQNFSDKCRYNILLPRHHN